MPAGGPPRTPIFKHDEPITPDQYELVEDRSDPRARARWGTLFLLRAKPGTPLYDHLAAWPLAMEVAMQTVCARNFPPAEYSIYVHGHSTGGPFAHLLLQRVENIAGLVGTETSPFGKIYRAMHPERWNHPFNDVSVRTWRDIARYRGYIGELPDPPLPPLLYAITNNSRDHTREMYERTLMPMLAAMDPPPRVHLTRFQAGVHSYLRAEEDLPRGVAPAMGQLWLDAITRGLYI